MEKVKRYLVKYIWVLVLLLSIPAVQALLIPGYFGASDDMHIGWLYEMERTFKIGQIPPRFVPDLSFGFGYPLFNFVFPLPFYLAEFVHLLGFSLVDSVKTVFLLSIPLSGLLMYKLLREIANPGLSILGAIIYMYTPYRATDIYVRGAIGEAVAFIFLPLIVWATLKLAGSWCWIGIFALSFGALILSHNITVYMFLPAVLLLALLLLWFGKINKQKYFLRIALSLFLGLLSSIYFWLPALLDSKLMKYDTVFNFADHFPTLKQLVTPYFGYGASVPGPYDGMSFFIGFLNLVLVPACFVLLLVYRRKFTLEQRIILAWSVVIFFISVIMMNYRSSFLWENIPLLPYFQFPWRFLILTTLVTPLMVTALSQVKYNFTLSLLLTVIIIVFSANFYRPHDFLGRFDDYYLNRYIPTPTASAEYLTLQEEYLRLPKDTKSRPTRNFPLVFGQNLIQEKIIKNDGLNSIINIETSSSGQISYSKYYFPGWEVQIDGQKANILSGSPFGQINIPLASGSHRLEVQFKETLRNKIFDLISIGAFLLCLLFLNKKSIERLLAKNKQERYN